MSPPYVSPFGVDSAGCGPQNSPCRNIDFAVGKALTGDTILVAGGTYQLANTPTCAGNVVCVFNKSTTILGGTIRSRGTSTPSRIPP